MAQFSRTQLVAIVRLLAGIGLLLLLLAFLRACFSPPMLPVPKAPVTEETPRPSADRPTPY